MTIIVPYKAGSASAKTLADSLGVKRFNVNNRRSRFLRHGCVINWGNSSTWWLDNVVGLVLNHPDNVYQASCKRRCFEILGEAGVSIPEVYTSQHDAIQAFPNDGGDNTIIICRTTTTGNSGEGIVIAERPSEVVEAPLYTKYIPKQQEYRVHVADGEIIDVQRKARNRDVPDEEINWKIRNTENGFIFMREGITPGTVPPDVLVQSVNAVLALGLDFGAVDVIWNEHRSRAYVLEVNTAPGLEGTTIDRYMDFFLAVMDPGHVMSTWDEIQGVSEPSEEPVVQSQESDRVRVLSYRLSELQDQMNSIRYELEQLGE